MFEQPHLKTMMFCTSFIGEELHLKRYQRYLKYYIPKMDQLGVDKIVLIDDGSPFEWLVRLGVPIYDAAKLPKSIEANVCVFRFADNLGRPVLTIIPGWWRSFSFASVIGARYNLDKLVHIESDAYILTDRMLDWIKQTNNEWSSPYTWRYWYAETAIQIIPRKSIPILYQFWKAGKEFWYKNFLSNIQYIPELILPIQNVNKTDFKGDRWGEDWWAEDIPENADFVCNVGAITCASAYCDNSSKKIERFFQKHNIYIV